MNGSVFTAAQTNRSRQQPFQPVPETDSIQQRIQNIGDGAIMAVLRVGMMQGMVSGGLQNVHVLEK
jgi:hypothetical protein